jgi:hypothetical protein
VYTRPSAVLYSPGKDAESCNKVSVKSRHDV